MDSSKSSLKHDVAIAHGDGIGPEIMKATLEILENASCDLIFHEIEVGEKVYLKGFSQGIEPKSWDILRSTKAFLKAPISTPQGGGFRSLNVTIRAALGLYANVRPCVAYHPFVETKHPGMDIVIVRENEEDLYTGIEYRPTHETFHALKVITKKGCEKIVRYAFEYAKKNGRKKVTCFTKDNILKMTDGLFHKTFEDIAKEYPDIGNEHWIIDIGAAKMADTPEAFDVIVMPNLYGDILSDVAAQIAGSVGLAGSANIGATTAMFEAIHGSAPRRAGQNLANPSGLLLAAVMMLVHLGKLDAATNIHNAWLRTLEEGIHTYDIFDEARSKEKVGTQEFAKAVISFLGEKPKIFPPVKYTQTEREIHKEVLSSPQEISKELVGADISIEWTESIEKLVAVTTKILPHSFPLALTQITNRGVVVFPAHFPIPCESDLMRCRFTLKEKSSTLSYVDIIQLQKCLQESSLLITKAEALYYFGQTPGYSFSSE